MSTEDKNKEEIDSKKEEINFLILHNDDVNSFDHVIESLQEICGHTIEQAEQCTLIAHFNGQCDIKSGSSRELQRLKRKFSSKYLTTTIE